MSHDLLIKLCSMSGFARKLTCGMLIDLGNSPTNNNKSTKFKLSGKQSRNIVLEVILIGHIIQTYLILNSLIQT